jgi:hypothetical protein
MAKSESKELRTTAEVIEALGGRARVAELTGRTAKQVWDWAEEVSFPSRYFAVMWLELAVRGYSAPLALWGQTLSRNREVMLTTLARKLRVAA